MSNVYLAFIYIGSLCYFQEPTIHCERLELNHVYDANGKLYLDQLIIWDYDEVIKKYTVRSWTIVPASNRVNVNDQEVARLVDVWKTKNPHHPIPDFSTKYVYNRWMCQYNESSKTYRTTITISYSKQIIVVDSLSFLETWTTYDRELENRAIKERPTNTWPKSGKTVIKELSSQ